MLIFFYILYLIWIYTITQIEFYFYTNRIISYNTANAHLKINLSRIPIFLMLWFMHLAYTPMWFACIGICSLLLMFPFWHDGWLYQIYKNKTNGYDRGFWSDPSGTSGAKINFRFIDRLIIFVLGLAFAIIDCTIYFINN